MRFLKLIFLVLAMLSAPIVFAQTAPNEADIEQRAHEVGKSLRCVVCQNQSIDESDAPLARDMRKLVRTRLKAGDSNEDVIAFMRERYGDFVLIKPPVQGNTYVLWGMPFVLLLLGLIWYFRHAKRRRAIVSAPGLSADEKAAYERLTSKPKDGEAP